MARSANLGHLIQLLPGAHGRHRLARITGPGGTLTSTALEENNGQEGKSESLSSNTVLLKTPAVE